MFIEIRRNKAAFTLVEIMIVVAIIGLLAALAIPGFVKQSQGRRIINDARQMDAAIVQWALKKGKKDNDAINTTEAATYLKSEWKANDLLNNAYSVGAVGSNQVKISGTTKTALDGVGLDWGPY